MSQTLGLSASQFSQLTLLSNSLKAFSSITPELISKLRQIIGLIYGKELEIGNLTVESRQVYEAILQYLSPLICVKHYEYTKDEEKKIMTQKKDSRSVPKSSPKFPSIKKCIYEISRDYILWIFKKLCHSANFSSRVLSKLLLQLSFNHLQKCKYCTETISMLLKLLPLCRDLRTAAGEPTLFNLLIDIYSKHCNEVLHKGTSFYAKIPPGPSTQEGNHNREGIMQMIEWKGYF